MDALVFDFDGLLLDTETPEFVTVAAVFADHGLDLDRDWWRSEVIGTTDHPHWSEILAERLGCELPDREELLARRLRAHHALIAAEQLRPGVVNLLDAAAREGIPCAVASSSSLEWVDGHLERLGVRHRFAVLRTREDVGAGRTKPAPDVYLAACEAVGAAPSRSVALEDSQFGVAAALAAGMAVVGVASGMTAGLRLGAHLEVVSLAGVALDDLRRLVAADRASRD